jgi:hypothetical protein
MKKNPIDNGYKKSPRNKFYQGSEKHLPIKLPNTDERN